MFIIIFVQLKQKVQNQLNIQNPVELNLNWRSTVKVPQQLNYRMK